MLAASQLRGNMALKLAGEVWKVLSAEFHGGGGKMGGVTHAHLKNLRTGTQREWRFRADEMVETVDLERRAMQFLFTEGDTSTFMDPQTFEQVAVENALLGKAVVFLTPDGTLGVEFCEGRPVGVSLPEHVDVRVAETTASAHTQGSDNVWKEARLENGLTILVPPFIGPGELIRVSVADAAYVERARERRR
jgi:elongation factor P